MNQAKLNDLIDAHERWCRDPVTGVQLALKSEVLKGLSLAGRSLIDSHLEYVDLREADLNKTKLAAYICKSLCN